MYPKNLDIQRHSLHKLLIGSEPHNEKTLIGPNATNWKVVIKNLNYIHYTRTRLQR